jgi:hypothetical protein
MTAVHLPKHGLTFVHIPKNAGNSVLKWFHNHRAELDNQVYFYEYHQSLTQMACYLPIMLTFAIVRNPYARVVSGYLYAKNGQSDWCKHFRAINKLDVNNFPDFSAFVDKLETYKTMHWFDSCTNQYEWVGNGVNFLLRLEQLDEDFKIIQNLLGIHEGLGKENHIDQGKYQDYYTDKDIKKISKIFEHDLDFFKYTY